MHVLTQSLLFEKDRVATGGTLPMSSLSTEEFLLIGQWPLMVYMYVGIKSRHFYWLSSGM